MKRLYNCSAECDTFGMRSYSTQIFDDENGYIWCYYYYSATTCQHCHKYMKWLRESGLQGLANIVENLYYTAQKAKSTNCAVYNKRNGEIMEISREALEKLVNHKIGYGYYRY